LISYQPILDPVAQAFADKLRHAGVRVTAVRFQGTIDAFVMLNALADTRWSPPPFYQPRLLFVGQRALHGGSHALIASSDRPTGGST
jgi:acetyl esterase/lipase